MVSTDCPYGPGEIVRDGEDGLLVPVGDAAALGAALLDLVRDDERRRRMGGAALANARRFAPAPVVARAEALFGEAVEARNGGGRGVPARGGLPHTLRTGGYAARDLARAAATSALRTVRKGRR